MAVISRVGLNGWLAPMGKAKYNTASTARPAAMSNIAGGHLQINIKLQTYL